MNKLFSYSKTAAFCIIFLLALQIALIFIEGRSLLYITNGLSALYCVLWIVLFALIAKESVKKSPLKIPSFIAGSGYVLSIVSIILFIIGYTSITNGSYNYTLYSVANIVNISAMVATVVGFIWLSRYFSKGSSQRIASYIIAIVIIVNPLVSILYHPWEIEDEAKRTLIINIRSIIGYVATYGSASFFLFSLSKLKK